VRPPHGCRCCGLTARHDDDCLIPEMARVVVERDRLRALICEWQEADRAISDCGALAQRADAPLWVRYLAAETALREAKP